MVVMAPPPGPQLRTAGAAAKVYGAILSEEKNGVSPQLAPADMKTPAARKSTVRRSPATPPVSQKPTPLRVDTFNHQALQSVRDLEKRTIIALIALFVNVSGVNFP
uniref:Uncharacterized protein n=1 Tax=Timema cristinae TaxID=61476 RepID=A0A7R9CUG2_TIMCR|nr:unnamed protein product [Timema cristinae]